MSDTGYPFEMVAVDATKDDAYQKELVYRFTSQK